ncbi:efflux RND transporter periplasmic adaptor subunit [Staphylococcus kloosii]|uniref:efflux RND transporter periplasmic adaptor subunit n=1 Tax=Staphylococcus kloosii TaxID=29384 RepID=UPI001E485F47|nr:efflux RND transporter periplasmic adaptor subunit [Staphylococcus kloosii]MCD8879166.1 efflux RND transporter periplasmic adaptor subunit [Staphylococcus kloosii]
MINKFKRFVKSTKGKWLIVIALVSVLLIYFAVKKVNSFNSSNKEQGYDTYQVEKVSALKLQGKATPKLIKTYNNNSQIGTFISTRVTDGQKVKQGEPLINYNIYQNKRQQLVQKVDEAQKNVNDDYKNINKEPRNNELQKKLTQDQVALSEAQQQLNQHDRQVNDSIYATFDGKIDIQNSGNLTDGQPILQLVSDEAQIKTKVSEFDLESIKKGDKVDIKVTNNGKKGKGEIKKIAELPKSYEHKVSEPLAASSDSEDKDAITPHENPVDSDPNGGNDAEVSKYTVIINNIDIPLRAGYSIEITVPLDAIKLPSSVLTKDNRVFVLTKDNKVEKREITIDKVNKEIFVKKGLKPGDKLIVDPKKSLNDGDKVEVAS